MNRKPADTIGPAVEIPEPEPVGPQDTLLNAGRKLCRMHASVLWTGDCSADCRDAERVHRMRVAVRKLRFIVQLWAPYLDAKKTRRLRKELKWLSQLLGDVRDAAVLRERFDRQWAEPFWSTPLKKFIGNELDKKETEATTALEQAYLSERYERLLADLDRHFGPPVPAGDGPPASAVVPGLFRIAVKKTGRFAGRKLAFDEIHAFRIAFKRLRYMTEFFGNYYRGTLHQHLGRFRKYQEVLGLFCDAYVAESFLRSLAGRAPAATPEERNIFLELGCLIQTQRIDSLKQFRRFEKKAVRLPDQLKLLRRRTKVL